MTRRGPRGSADAPSTSQARRARIVEAALEEFVARGFEAASTNAIATRAGVAKGLVFHYFGTKDALYLAVFDRANEEFQDAITTALDPAPPTDLFARLHHFSAVKMRVISARPPSYRFLVQAASTPPKHLAEALHERLRASGEAGMQTFLDGLDFSKLRPQVSPEQAIAVVMLLRDGMERRYLPRLLEMADDDSQLAAFAKEALAMFELLRDGLYRRE